MSWPIFLEDDLREVSEERAHEITRMVMENMVVVLRNQKLTPEEELRFVSMCGNYQKNDTERGRHMMVTNGILKVGEGALFGHKKALDWHANQPSNPERMPLIWLYGVESTEGSRTSWINMIEAFKDLDPETKEIIEDVSVHCGYKKGSYSEFEYFKEHVNYEYSTPLVYTNAVGKKGLFFPFLQIFDFDKGDPIFFQEIMEELTEHVLQEKYMYHHDWKDGDIVLSEQWLSIHKRWDFEGMDKRVLHRIAYDHELVSI